MLSAKASSAHPPLPSTTPPSNPNTRPPRPPRHLPSEKEERGLVKENIPPLDPPPSITPPITPPILPPDASSSLFLPPTKGKKPFEGLFGEWNYSSIRYTAPEIIEKGWFLGGVPASDVWSFGLLLFEMVRRKKPFFSLKEDDIPQQILDGESFGSCDEMDPKVARLVQDCTKMDHCRRPKFSDICRRLALLKEIEKGGEGGEGGRAGRRLTRTGNATRDLTESLGFFLEERGKKGLEGKEKGKKEKRSKKRSRKEGRRGERRVKKEGHSQISYSKSHTPTRTSEQHPQPRKPHRTSTPPPHLTASSEISLPLSTLSLSPPRQPEQPQSQPMTTRDHPTNHKEDSKWDSFRVSDHLRSISTHSLSKTASSPSSSPSSTISPLAHPTTLPLTTLGEKLRPKQVFLRAQSGGEQRRRPEGTKEDTSPISSPIIARSSPINTPPSSSSTSSSTTPQTSTQNISAPLVPPRPTPPTRNRSLPSNWPSPAETSLTPPSNPPAYSSNESHLRPQFLPEFLGRTKEESENLKVFGWEGLTSSKPTDRERLQLVLQRRERRMSLKRQMV